MAWTNSDFYGGNGTKDYPFIIKDKEGGFTALEQFTNGIRDANYVGKGYYFQLGQDLDYNHSARCVGGLSTPFVGTIDGNGYTIKNIYSDYTASSEVFFMYGGKNSYLKNCVFKSISFYSRYNRGQSGSLLIIDHMKSCRFEQISIDGSKSPSMTFIVVLTGGDVKDCIFNQSQESARLSNVRIINANGSGEIYLSNLLIMGTYYNTLPGAYSSSQGHYNNISDCMQLSSSVINRARICDLSNNYDKRDIHNCYAREDCMVGSSVPTQYCTKDHINGESVSADVYQQKGFWDGTGVDGTVYLNWDFENVWDWDDVNLKPVLRLEHKDPIILQKSFVYVKTENGWVLNTDIRLLK